mmetsp:Transcript_78359/g.229683  ORF Transcript_78359/g.229683 Transcript_78359/m.229683 type:complete len:251 (+) Transcript_78359:830-1582(+)
MPVTRLCLSRGTNQSVSCMPRGFRMRSRTTSRRDLPVILQIMWPTTLDARLKRYWRPGWSIKGRSVSFSKSASWPITGIMALASASSARISGLPLVIGSALAKPHVSVRRCRRVILVASGSVLKPPMALPARWTRNLEKYGRYFVTSSSMPASPSSTNDKNAAVMIGVTIDWTAMMLSLEYPTSPYASWKTSDPLRATATTMPGICCEPISFVAQDSTSRRRSASKPWPSAKVSSSDKSLISALPCCCRD